MVTLAAAKAIQNDGGVLILLDCEDNCPAQFGPDLLNRARDVRADAHFIVALAYREYETWFVTAARSLRGRRGLPSDLEPPPNPEAIRNAKGWLGRLMEQNYDPVAHQLEFTRLIDFDEARGNPSFDRLYQRVSDFLTRDVPGAR
jgi:hypothetical protein